MTELYYKTIINSDNQPPSTVQSAGTIGGDRDISTSCKGFNIHFLRNHNVGHLTKKVTTESGEMFRRNRLFPEDVVTSNLSIFLRLVRIGRLQ